MHRLDKRRDYGTCHNDDEGRAYHQDGHYFNAAGECMECKHEKPNARRSQLDKQLKD